MAAFSGIRGTGDWGADERPKDFRESILFYNPNGTAPLFALTSKIGKRKATDPEFAWWAEGQMLIRLQVNGALAAGDTTVVVDSADPTATTASANYGTALNLKPGDILLVEPSADNATFDHELVEVTSVQSATQFTVSRGVGGTTAGSIANDAWLLVIGSAYAEGTSAPSAVSRNPLKFYNYTQIFKDTYELTGTADATKARTGSPWSNDKKRKMFKHSSDIEFAMLFGRKQETTGSNGKPKRFMGGLREFIPASNVTVFGSAVTISSFYDALAPAYSITAENGAGDTRIGFCGHQAILELNKVFQANGNTQFGVGTKLTTYGMNFVEFIMPHGTIMFKTHPLLSQHPLYKKSMFVVDHTAAKYTHLAGRDTKARDDVQAKDEDVRRGFWQTECSLMVEQGGLTCAYLGNISAT